MGRVHALFSVGLVLGWALLGDAMGISTNGNQDRMDDPPGIIQSDQRRLSYRQTSSERRALKANPNDSSSSDSNDDDHENGIFTLASLKGTYSYANQEANIGSYGIMYFDGRGGVTTPELRANTPTPDNTRVLVSLGSGVGVYDIGSNGNGTVFLTFPDSPSLSQLDYEFVVTKSSGSTDETLPNNKVKMVYDMTGFLMTGGLDGQLVVPYWSRI